MKTRSITILAATAVALIALAFSGCDRTIDDINPEPISPGATGPGTAWQSLMQSGGMPLIEQEEDTTSGGGDEDAVTGDDTVVGQDTIDDVACSGSDTYCSCLAVKDGDEERYGEYCDCMDAAQVPSLWDIETYCGCCFFAFDPSYPEYDGEGNGNDKPWGVLAATFCTDIEPASCNWD